MSLSLYEISHQHRAMVEALMESTDDAVAIKDTIEAESYPLEVKAQNLAFAVKSLEATATAIKNAEAEMVTRRKSIENRVMHLKDYALTCMQIAGVSKIDCPHFAINIRQNPPSVDIFEPALIPAEYMKQTPPPPPSADKVAIKEAIKAGVEVPGAMMQSSSRLEIK